IPPGWGGPEHDQHPPTNHQRKGTPMQKTKLQALAWAISLIFTARLVWVAAQHHMPVLDTAAIALLVLYAAKAGAENIINGVRNTRTGGPR
ncbi:hypothetical protein PV378_42290, partial [Streptomyces scabiei]